MRRNGLSSFTFYTVRILSFPSSASVCGCETILQGPPHATISKTTGRTTCSPASSPSLGICTPPGKFCWSRAEKRQYYSFLIIKNAN